MGDSNFLTTKLMAPNEMNPFQQACRKRIDAVLSKHDLGDSTWIENPGARETFYKDVLFDGAVHTIALFPDNVNMTTTDGRLFEVFLRDEFLSPGSLIDGFTRRLDSYLSHGSWEQPSPAVSPQSQDTFGRRNPRS